MSPRRLTILYVLSSASLGGANRSMSVLLSRLDRARFRPLVIVPSDGPLLQRLAAWDIPARVLPLPSLARLQASPQGKLKAALRNSRNMLRLLALIRREAVDLIHTSTIFPLGGALGALLTGRPHVWHLREGLDTPQYDLRFGRSFSRSLIGALSQQLICISEYVRSVSVPASAMARAVVVYNALESVPVPVVSDAASPLVAAIGLIGEKKRTALFVETAILLAGSRPQVRFLVAGLPTAGEEAVLESCRRRAEAAGLAERFTWPGFVEDADRLYDGVRLLLHPGTHEAFGRVLVEAMARGIPVVAVRSGAVPELIVDGVTGRVVQPDSAPALAAAAAAVLQDPMLHAAMAAAARRDALERFAPQRHAARIMALYGEAVA